MTLTPPEMLCFALYSATHAMTQAYKPLLDGIGLTYPQYLVMSLLWAQDGQPVGALGRQLQLDSNTLTPLLKRLEGEGLVSRRRDDRDERQVHIHLTPAGTALADKASTIPDCFFRKTGLPIEAVTDLRDRLSVLRDQLRAPDPA